MKNKVIELLNANGVVYRINSESSLIEVPFVEEKPINGKRCVAYYCASNESNGKPWKVEINGTHLKWVKTKQEAQELINLIES